MIDSLVFFQEAGKVISEKRFERMALVFIEPMRLILWQDDNSSRFLCNSPWQ